MIKINSLDHFGRGISKIDNKIIFVENAIPNEEVEINIINNKKKYIEAEVNKYINISKERIDPKCPYYDICGGCNIMHLNYKSQLTFKNNKIKNIVSKYLNGNIKINNIIASKEQFFYRNKATFQINKKIGLYKKESYEIVNIDKCYICNKLINDSIPYLNKLDLTNISKIICRVANNSLMIIIESNKKDIDINILKDIANSIYIKCNNNYKLVYGDKYIYENIDKYKFAISPDSFFQINIDVCKKLYSKVKEYVGINKNVIDLYCGTGTIGICSSEKNNVLGIEINKYAIEDANINKKINNIENIKFICNDSGKGIKNTDFNIDTIIVDPPRNGLNKETINNIINTKVKNIIYISCDPMTLVRDLKILSENYKILEITPFDMFPNTYHVENVVILKIKEFMKKKN